MYHFKNRKNIGCFLVFSQETTNVFLIFRKTVHYNYYNIKPSFFISVSENPSDHHFYNSCNIIYPFPICLSYIRTSFSTENLKLFLGFSSLSFFFLNAIVSVLYKFIQLC